MDRSLFSLFRNRWLLALCLGLCALVPENLRAQTLQIDSLKADWIDGFADFSTWDKPRTETLITIGVIGAPQLLTYLEQTCSERQHSPRLTVQSLVPEHSLEGIDILFLGPNTEAHWQNLSRKARDRSVLLISAEQGFVENGGAIQFVVRKNRLRFRINETAAKECGVAISSKLLELALHSE